ncbi:MAG: right-handed parallel beta-helix repeat-containing protein [Bryobacterales bacterium]|nr:right-handed parallel beta-helix repeat-containing protein [Acidobacteriota bacterium]MCZ2149697.1 right-handed parallel beta-helix repeat-containing protein [Bryobacterales bacterium]
MKLDRRLFCLICFAVSVLWSPQAASAKEIEGTITTTLTITENSVLVGDVTCAVESAPCIAFGAPDITLDLDGYAITGQADPDTACSGGGVGTEIGIDVNGQNGAIIRGPGVVRQMRGFGIRLNNSSGGKITGVTASTTCFAGFYLNASSGYELEGNVSVRNGHLTNPCGGI